MKLRNLFIPVIALATVASCNDMKELIEPEAGISVTLEATVDTDSPQTRVSFDKDGGFHWTEGDIIGVTSSNVKTAFSEFKLTEGAGTGTGKFEGSISGTLEGYAVYPLNSGDKVDGNILTHVMPATYEYTKVDDRHFLDDKASANSRNTPMWGKIENDKVNFKHLGGAIALRVAHMPVAEGSLVFSTDEKLNGTFKTDLNVETPYLRTSTTEDASEKMVTINFVKSAINQQGVFYIPAAVGTYNNCWVVIKDNEDKIVSKTPMGTVEIERTTLWYTAINNAEIEGGATNEINNVTEFAAAVEKANTATEDVTLLITEDITLDKAYTLNNAKGHKITVNSLNGAKLIVPETFEKRLNMFNVICNANVEIKGAKEQGEKKQGYFTIGDNTEMNGTVTGTAPSASCQVGLFRILSQQPTSNVNINNTVSGYLNVRMDPRSGNTSHKVTFLKPVSIKDGCISTTHTNDLQRVVIFKDNVIIEGKATLAEGKEIPAGCALKIGNGNKAVFEKNILINKNKGDGAVVLAGEDSKFIVNGNLEMKGSASYYGDCQSATEVKGELSITNGNLDLLGYAVVSGTTMPQNATSLTVGTLNHIEGTTNIYGGDARNDNERTILTVTKAYTIGESASLYIEQRTGYQKSGKLLINQGATLTNNGKITNNGVIDNKGTYSGNGTVEGTGTGNPTK